MKRLLIFIFSLFHLAAFAQVESTISAITTATGTTHALILVPSACTGATKCAVILQGHGAGEAGTNLATIYNSSSAGMAAYLIEHSGWPSDGGFINPKTGLKEYVIVVTPQTNNGWSSSGDDADAEFGYVQAHYNTDTTKYYTTGLSAGGAMCFEHMFHLDPNEDAPTGANNHVRRWKVAASLPMSTATNEPQASWVQKAVTDSIPAWTLGDQNNDVYGDFALEAEQLANAIKANYWRNTDNPPFTYGHGGWNNFYSLSYTEVINGQSMNWVQWLLTNRRPGSSTAPTANAGSNQTITLPTSTVTLSGSGTPGAGSITTYAWTKSSGPSGGTIASPSSASTGISALQQGVYVFQLTVTQTDAQTASATVTITVNSGTPVAIVSPTSQTINLPTTTATLDASSSTGTITSYAWTKVSGPSGGAITSASSATTTVTGLGVGQYIYQISLNSGASTAKDTINVNNIPQPYGSPVNSVSPTSASISVNNQSFTSSYTLDSATLVSITWSKFSVPGQTAKKLGVIGSSTMEGNGASVNDSAVAYRIYNYYHGLGLISAMADSAVTGYNVFQGMPTGSVPPSDVTAKLSPQDVPDTLRNVTAILKTNPDVVIIGFPSNGVDGGITVAEYMLALRTEYNYITAAGKACFIGTPQPREDFTAPQCAELQVIRDSVLAQFGTHALNFWTGVTVPGGTARLVIYADPASQYHLNDAGHNVLFHVIQAANILQSFAISSSVVTTPNQQNTTVTSLPNGVNKFQVSVQDSHGQFSSAVSTLTVSVSGAPTANAGTDQSITLPTSTVTLDGTASTGTITSRSWTRISGPNTPSFATPTAATCVVTGLIAGTYVFQLALNGTASTATVNVTVLPIPACSHNVWTITPDPIDSSYDATPSALPGDTVELADGGKAFSQAVIESLNGSQACPITIMAAPSQHHATKFRGPTAQLKLNSCTYIKLTGGGVPGWHYGINISYDADTTAPWNYNTASGGYFSVAVNGRSKNIEIDSIYARHGSIGLEVKEDGGCDNTLNKTGSPSDWVIDSVHIHDNRFTGTWNEGMYLGNTSPDNDSTNSDPRAVVCGGVTIYPRPIRLGQMKVDHNIVDSTGRSSIQMVSGSGSAMEIDHNIIHASGINGDEQQGAGITTGTYASPYIHDNTISDTYTWGISSEGGGVTGQVLNIQGNRIDSSGYLAFYHGAATHPDGGHEANLFTMTPNPLTYPHAIYIGSKPVDSLKRLDSIRISVTNNLIGLFKNNLGDFIQVQANQDTGDTTYNDFTKEGNIICSNTKLDGITPVTGVQNSDPGSPTVIYSTNCSGPTAPTCSIPIQRAIILPNNTASLTGVATPSAGQTISTYSWTQLSGPPATITSPSASSTTITGLYVNQNSVYNYYTFKLTVVQSDGQSASATIQLLAEIPGIPRHIGRRLIFK
jgi:hypothetical protein